MLYVYIYGKLSSKVFLNGIAAAVQRINMSAYAYEHAGEKPDLTNRTQVPKGDFHNNVINEQFWGTFQLIKV